MPDGCRLAARIWMPADAEKRPVPAIVEYIPYRKRDGTRARDECMHGYFAGHGYASLRIDIRGSGDSDGLLLDEYLPQEQDDGLAALAWIAAQPWCNGAIGMIGKSWGGFSALQIAARRPPQLKAVIALCATDDRYCDDAHFMGGCLLNENLTWGAMLFTLNAQPPDPQIVGARWRRMWLERLENNRPFAGIWLRHQRRDEYWRHGSVCEDFGRIACPVYAISGWADGYTNGVPRLLAGLDVPRKGLVGPWGHQYPHDGVPGPAIGFLQEALRWWDHWLRNIDTGIMSEPMYRTWMQDSVPPQPFYRRRPGRWIAEPSWPGGRIAWRRYEFRADASIAEWSSAPRDDTPMRISSPQDTGLSAGSWCGFGIDGEMPTDQRADDGKSLTFDSAPLASRLEILGTPYVEVHLVCSRPQGLLAVRLNDVAPDGASTRVSYGLLNLTHREGGDVFQQVDDPSVDGIHVHRVEYDSFSESRRSGHARPEALSPGKCYTVCIRLNDVAHSFNLGHRLRIALSTSYWPLVWASPEPVTVTMFPHLSALSLPVRAPQADDAKLRPFDEPEAAPASEHVDIDPGGAKRLIERDLSSGEIVYTMSLDWKDEGQPALTRVGDIDLEVGHAITEQFRIHEKNPLVASAEITHCAVSRRGDWDIRIETSTKFSATLDSFHLQSVLRGYDAGERVFEREWEERIPRDGV